MAGNAWYKDMPSHSACRLGVVLGEPGVDTWAHP